MPRVSDADPYAGLGGSTDRTHLVRTVDELRKDVQYLEEKRRKLDQFVDARRLEAQQCEQQARQLAAQLREAEDRCRRETAALHAQTQDAEAELRRKEEEVQAVRDSLARELDQKRARLRTMDEEVMRKRCETDAAISDHIKSLTAEVEAKRSALATLEADTTRKQAALAQLEAEASVRRRELELEDAALVRQMAEHQALCDSLRAQATEQLKDVEQRLAERRQELAAESRSFEAERFALEAQIASLQREVGRMETGRAAVQQREQSLTEQRRFAVDETQRLVAMVEDVTGQLEAARRATEAQALLAREWQALAEQATAAQKQEAALRGEATRTVEELRALIQQQELAIERLQQQSAARPASPASRSGPDAALVAEQMRTIEADFRAMKVTLDDSLALQSRLQNLLEDERFMRSTLEEQLRAARARSPEGEPSPRALHAQLLASEQARGVLEAELRAARQQLRGAEEALEEEKARRDTRGDSLAKQVVDAEAALQQQAAETVSWRAKCAELQLQLLRAQEAEDRLRAERTAEAERGSQEAAQDRERVWEELQQALARIQLVETQLQQSELERRAMQRQMEQEREHRDSDTAAAGHLRGLQARVEDLQCQLCDAKAVAADMERLLKREDEARQRLQAELARRPEPVSSAASSTVGSSTRWHDKERDVQELQTICQSMQDELADAHAARAALAADLAGVRERAAHLEQQLEASEEVRHCLAQELAQANALRQRLEARGHPG